MEDLKTTTAAGDIETESGDVVRVGSQRYLHNYEKDGHVQRKLGKPFRTKSRQSLQLLN
jgi:hypothetical protein